MNFLKKKGFTVLGFGLLLIVSMVQLYGVSTSLANRMQIPIIHSSVLPTEKELCTVNSNSKKDNTPRQIIIQKVGINLPVKKVSMTNGTWVVNDNAANYAAETSGISSEKGNIGLYAHDLQTGFQNIKNLKEGDIITIKGLDKVATYSVYSMFSTIPSNVDVFSQTKNPIVTLITCDGLFFEKRYVVQAKLVKITNNNCNEKHV